MKNRFDVAVIGLGGIGSAIVAALSRRGVRVAGLDARDVAHDQGSSHGDTRLLRVALGGRHRRELVRRSIELWRRLERDTDLELLRASGQIIVGGRDSSAVVGALEAARDGAVDVRPVGKSRLADLGMRCPPGALVLEDPMGGSLAVERSVKAHCSVAHRLGADVAFLEPVLAIESRSDGAEIVTTRRRLVADRVVLACGAWTAAVVPTAELRVHRVPQVWFEPRRSSAPQSFVYDLPEGDFYGAGLGGHPCKVGGPRIDALDDPDRRGTRPCDAAIQMVTRFVRDYVPALEPHPTRSVWCMSTASPDEEFIIDQATDDVVVACGFSGHGFKYAPAIGELIADHVCGERNSGLAPFRFERFGRGPLPGIERLRPSSTTSTRTS